MTSDSDQRLDALASLGDLVRRRMFQYVLDARTPVSREEVAAGTDVSRSKAAYRDLVCGARLALVEDVVAELGATRQHAVLDPGPDRCCVVVRAA